MSQEGQKDHQGHQPPEIVRLYYLLDITAWSELEAQAFRYTHINICLPCVCDK